MFVSATPILSFNRAQQCISIRLPSFQPSYLPTYLHSFLPEEKIKFGITYHPDDIHAACLTHTNSRIYGSVFPRLCATTRRCIATDRCSRKIKVAHDYYYCGWYDGDTLPLALHPSIHSSIHPSIHPSIHINYIQVVLPYPFTRISNIAEAVYRVYLENSPRTHNIEVRSIDEASHDGVIATDWLGRLWCW